MLKIYHENDDYEQGKLIIIIGSNGSGKNILLVYINSISQKPLLSNFTINSKRYKKLTKDMLIDLPDYHNVFIDEFYTWFESRTSFKEINQVISNVIFQKRKRELDIYGTVQMFSSIDKRARKQADILVFSEYRTHRTDDFHYDVYFVKENYFATIDISYKEAKKLFPLFNTNQVIPPDDYKHKHFKMIEQNPDKLLEYTEKYAKIIKPSLNKITLKTIQASLIFHKIDLGYAKYIHILLDNQLNLNKIKLTAKL